MKFLITGGAGYIGSTIASALIDAGHTPIILDSLITGREEFTRGRIFYKADIGDTAAVEQVFREHPDIYATVHCAALIIVPESVDMPYEYYTENVSKSIQFFYTLQRLGYGRVVFSSSASVYATPTNGYMVRESDPLNPLSPYARTKYMMEMVLKDFCARYDMRAIALRYFNPIGSDPQLRTGLHIQFPSLVVGKMVDVALGRLPEFHITGVDWPTRDGTGIRDYVHVWDLANAHVLALTDFDQVFARADDATKYLVINLGTGNGVTVREILAAFERVYGQEIPKRETPPRPGDVAGAYANADTAKRLLGWQPEMTLDQAIDSALKWGEKRKTMLTW